MANLKFDFDDILITPKRSTSINSRYDDINPYYRNELAPTVDRLPIFTAPMDTVVGLRNMFEFGRNKINVVLPRTEKYKQHATQFNSFGLGDHLGDDIHETFGFRFVLIDVANGHMKSVLHWCEELKKVHPKVVIMAGNIANPSTYFEYGYSGVVDYARIGIGNGNGCLTTQQTGVGYPMGSLIAECREYKYAKKFPTKIVADGGMKKYSDIIKALALGADYVMLGSILSKCIESSAQSYWKGFKLNRTLAHIMYQAGYKIQKDFRGMSTKEAQQALGNTTLKTSEGVTRRYDVEYTLEQWVDNFEHYLRSAMSYSDARTLEEFIGNASYQFITENAFRRFNK